MDRPGAIPGLFFRGNWEVFPGKVALNFKN